MNYGTRLTIEDRVGAFFHLDPVIPVEYLKTFQRTAALEPEKILMMAVLEDAIVCFQKFSRSRNGKTKQLFREAEDWILEQDDAWLFSFEQICMALGFEPGYVRAKLIGGKERPPVLSLKNGRRSTDPTKKKRCKKRKVQLAA